MRENLPAQSGNTLLLLLAGLAALIAGAVLASLLLRPPAAPELSAGVTRLEPPRVLGDFGLTDHHGANFGPQRLRGQWTFMFFGYTHCPDICPTTLTSLNAAARAIAALPEPPPAPQYVFVSIDPERDTPEQLGKFVPYFNRDFLGVTGTPAAIAEFTRQLSVMYLKVNEERGEGYLMDHSAAILLLDPEGRFHALFSPPFDPRAMAEDYLRLTHYYEATR
jgi:protein SCO1/2